VQWQENLAAGERDLNALSLGSLTGSSGSL